jgi:hypothetical protein
MKPLMRFLGACIFALALAVTWAGYVYVAFVMVVPASVLWVFGKEPGRV